MNYTVSREYDSDRHGPSTLTVDVLGVRPKLDSWQYDPPYIDHDPIHPNKDEVERPARFTGCDQTLCTVALANEDDSEYRHHASIIRRVTDPFDMDGTVDWHSSCAIRESAGIYIRPDKAKNRYDPLGSESESFWELRHGSAVTREDLVDLLLEEGWRLFENCPNDISI